MSEKKKIRLHQVATELNIGKDRIVDFLNSQGFQIANKPTTVLTDEMLNVIIKNFSKDKKTAENLKHQFGLDTPALAEGVIPSVTTAETTKTEEQKVEKIEDDLDSFFTEVIITEKEKQQVEATEITVEETIEVSEPKEVEVIEEFIEEKIETVTETITETVKVEPTVSELEHQVVEEEVVASDVSKFGEPKVGDIIDLTKTEIHRRKHKKELRPTREEFKKKKLKEEKVKETKPKEEYEKPKPKAKPVPTKKTPPEEKKTTTILEFEPILEEPIKADDLTEKPETIVITGEPVEIDERRIDLGEGLEEDLVQTKFFRKRGKKDKPIKEIIPRKKFKPKKGFLPESIESDAEIDKTIKETLHGIAEESDIKKRAKIRHKRKEEKHEKELRKLEEVEKEKRILHVSEFITTSDLAKMMNVEPTEVITKCFQLGLIVSLNQRLDKETIELVAMDFGYEVEFVEEKELPILELDFEDPPETLKPRPPIVTIMGHVDHGKTSLLDYIRKSNIVAGEAGGITQHIGAYQVEIPGKGSITFIDTPGHEAFTAMRARGAMVTDIVVLVVAADDAVMPQTVEAINHARAANVPIVVAINKIDKVDANPDRIKQQLAELGILVEEWGGDYQCAEISAKFGKNVDALLEKILLQAEFLDLKANPDRPAKATVVESHLDKGRGPVATAIVQKGTLKVGDIFVAGLTFGKVRAMFDERERKVESAGPSTPVRIIGFDSLPEAGDVIYVVETEQIARQIANKRQQLKREQFLRREKVLTLDDLSKQIQLGNIKELNLILKADVTGSLEAISDALHKLSNEEVKVSILHKGVGNVTESDVTLAAASNAVILAFQVSSTGGARKLAEKHSVEIRRYEIIYDLLNDVKMALEGLLSPDIQEVTTATLEIRKVFSISKVGNVAGCYVQSGKISRNDKIRVIRDGLIIHKGNIASLKRGKDDVREVDAGYECGLMIEKFNDIREGDILEAYKIVEVKKTLNFN